MINWLKNILLGKDEVRKADRVTSYELVHLNDLFKKDVRKFQAYALKLLIDYEKPRSTMISLSSGYFL